MYNIYILVKGSLYLTIYNSIFWLDKVKSICSTNILTEFQNGFRKNLSTIDTIFK